MEDVDHLLRRCPTTEQIWQALILVEELHKQQTLSFGKWIKHNTCESIKCDINSKWNVVFATTIWWMWCWRNSVVFKVEVKALDSKLVWIKMQVSNFSLVYAKGLSMEE